MIVVAYIPSALDFTLIVVFVIVVLLLLPSILTYLTKRRAMKQVDILLAQLKSDPERRVEHLDTLTSFYESTADAEGIAASTRMTIAVIALLIVGIALFNLISITSVVMDSSVTLSAASNSTTTVETNYSQHLIQLISTVLGILGGILSAAVGFFFGTHVRSDQKRKDET